MFFKKRITALDAATILLQWGPRSEEPVASLISDLAEGVDRNKALDEMLYLTTFAVCLAVSTVLAGNPVLVKILDAYFSLLVTKAEERKIGAEAYRSELAGRHRVYIEAVDTLHPDGPARIIGKAFSNLCVSEMNHDLTVIGGIIFSATYEGVSKWVKSVTIVPTGATMGILGWLKWLADKSEGLPKKGFEFALEASFHHRMFDLQRKRPELSTEQRISEVLYELLDDRYPNWAKDEKIAVVNRYNSCRQLLDFIYDYEMKTYGKNIFVRTKDSFRGLP